MKMNPEDFAALRGAIDALSRDALAVNWLAYKAKNLSAMRFRWDVLHASGFKIMPLYNAGLDDSHIDTALRNILHTITD